MRKRHISAIVLSLIGCAGPIASAQWNQFGGPHRNFMVDSKGLADQWPEAGPKQIWKRALGDGFATVSVDDGRLFTLFRADDIEHVVALDAKNGDTLWERTNPAEVDEGKTQFGPGPHATPLVLSDQVITVGIDAFMQCLDKRDGKILWQHDLHKEFGGAIPGRGYSSSPIAYKDTVIVPVGGEDTKGQALMAFKVSDGSVVWKNQDFEITHSSPIMIQFEGKDQLVVFMAEQVAGLDPTSGELLWQHEHKTQYGANLSLPLWTGDDLIFCSAAYDSGSRVIRLVREDGKIVPKELWYNRKLRIHHANAVRIGDFIYGSSGDFGPAFFTAVNIKTGDLAWRERGFSKATCLLADGKIILLDEDGQLALCKPDAEGLKVLSKCQLTQRVSWTAPTLVGTTLYVRDRASLVALDLS